MRTVDLSQPLSDGLEGYPGDPGVSFELAHDHSDKGYRVSELHIGSHVGTHVDAPSHVLPGGDSVDALGLDAFVGPARLVDLGELPPRAEIPAEAVSEHAAPGCCCGPAGTPTTGRATTTPGIPRSRSSWHTPAPTSMWHSSAWSNRRCTTRTAWRSTACCSRRAA